jgi:hypothetical protein
MKRRVWSVIKPTTALLIRMPVSEVKPGKTRKLNYHCSLAVDTAEGVISHVQADYADGRESQLGFPRLYGG